ncbi:SDR family NAD(P)-dependent oxidoreductase [Marinobacter sp. F3R11]|uniref:SDR family NAD(P)-dependent oxidoreductase n=1 Tax=Marinobacter sp. F3R11 TaxID=2267231 RepID=UPI000DEB2790|nr:SDR family NAD(P)-dependent oxidoreductase [Marinobacter sp. F3R11]RBW51208.1 3-hydroxyacyl-CoA dehydrogenase [Marinobacter sp. F3R11]
MDVRENSVVVTGGASGLGQASVRKFIALGAYVVIADLPGSAGQELADELGERARFVAADVTDESQMRRVFEVAGELAPLRVCVHCAGRGGALRILDKEGNAGSLQHYEDIVSLNLVGSFNVLRLAAEQFAKTEPVNGERGVCILTSSVAAWEGQIGQIPYASAKAGIVGMTLVAARDLASRLIRVCTIAPGIFDTPIISRLPEQVKESLGKSVPHPARLGDPKEYAALAAHIVENQMLNGETIRLDGAIRMGPR